MCRLAWGPCSCGKTGGSHIDRSWLSSLPPVSSEHGSSACGQDIALSALDRLGIATAHRSDACLPELEADRGGPARAIHSGSGQCCGRVVDIARTNNLSC
uniref:Uncharacterized protein n=1 Tax=blood disease bacterium R229 TaxID=741978 RepID=G2ZKU9_9RALS|nr:hypothetical protein BDB_80043 [blood disease bacterium R229]